MSSKRNRSLREHLLALAKQHPEWSYKQFAAFLGQNPDTIRGAFSVLRRKGLLKPRQTIEEPESVVKKRIKKPPSKVKPSKGIATGRMITASRQIGYLKLI